MIAIALFVCIAGVLILRPLTKRAGLLLETVARERARPSRLDEGQLVRLAGLVEQVSARVDRIDDRVDFVERLLDHRAPAPRLRTPAE
jgi:cytochrome c-type biogenesis protein CcmE